MNVVHRIAGYDKVTEFIAQEFDVPPDRIAEVRELAKVDPRIDELVGACPLDPAAAEAVRDRLELGMWIETCDWFFEPFAVP